MPFSELSDEQLMREAAEGRFSAFEEFLERHQGRLLNFFWRLTGSLESAEALFESSVPEFYRARGSLGAVDGAQALLFGVAARKAMRLLAEMPTLGKSRGMGAASSAGDKASLEWRSERLNDALLSLPLRERSALLLCFFDSLSYAAAAAALNEREENIRTLCGHGLARLRETLGEGFLSGGLN